MIVKNKVFYDVELERVLILKSGKYVSNLNTYKITKSIKGEYQFKNSFIFLLKVQITIISIHSLILSIPVTQSMLAFHNNHYNNKHKHSHNSHIEVVHPSYKVLKNSANKI